MRLGGLDAALLDGLDELDAAAEASDFRYADAAPSRAALAMLTRLEHVRPLLSSALWSRRGGTTVLCFARWPEGAAPAAETLADAVLTRYLAARCRWCGSRWHALVVDFDLVVRPRCDDLVGQLVTDILGPVDDS
ncbi:MAG: hypothetical protein KC486_08390 [Myxococcales bacterium]|nr:hypothetical protein [Myxococcales bacterium]